jgi:adenylate cyclase class IV
MSRNIEIKARVDDVASIRARAAALASGPAEIIDQTDTFFVVSRGRLKVRAFADGSGELIAYERADTPGPKPSTYTRVECRDASALSEALAGVLPVRGVVVKRRELFLVGRTRIHLDQVEALGSFVELEVVLAADESPENGRQEALELLASLQISETTLVAEAYIDLLERQAASVPAGVSFSSQADAAGAGRVRLPLTRGQRKEG